MIDKTEYFQKLGRQVRVLRAGKDISQEELSEACGVSQRAISALENGKPVSDKSIDKIMSHFDKVVIVEAKIIDKLESSADENV